MTHRVSLDLHNANTINRTLVFDVLRRRGIVTRIGLVRETGLGKATISQIVDQLIRNGFARTLGPGQSNGGRRPVLIEFNPHARHVVGVELSEVTAHIVLTDLSAAPLVSREVPLAGSTSQMLDSLIAGIAELTSAIPSGSLLGIGLGLAGMVDSHRGIVLITNEPHWQDVPIAARVADHFGVPVGIVNRAKLAALGEAWHGAGRDVDSLVYINIASGISAGIVLDGRLYRGASMSEGAIGHVTVVLDGPLCICGNRGCLQTVAAAGPILSLVRERLRDVRSPILEELEPGPPDRLTLPVIGQAATMGDPLVLDVLGLVAQHIGVVAANMVNILNPRRVVLGGSVIQALPSLVPTVQTEVRRRAVSVSASAVEIVSSQLGGDAVPLGAAAYILGQVSITESAGVLQTATVTPDVVHPQAGSHAAHPDHSRRSGKGAGICQSG